MREIKFRAWDKFGKRWVINPRWQACNNSVGTILEQYTGLKDKNGKEIYEGDTFKSSGEVWVIAWNDDAACYLYESPRWSKDQHGYQFTCDVACEVEVIGNIHENPELLEQK